MTEEKIEQIKELVQEIERINDLLFMYEGDRITLDIAKKDLWKLLKSL